MRFHVVSIFPDMMELATRFGVVGQAIKDRVVTVEALSPRVFTTNVHQTVDDRPFGGGDGMVMLAEPLEQAIEQIRSRLAVGARAKVIHLSPRGRPFSDTIARELTEYTDLILVASRYGGVDQRFLNQHCDEELSIGDYVLSGGELPALIVIDAVSRLLPGVLGNDASSEEESFAKGLLEYPQYTRPREWRGVVVPEALLSGDHARIEHWKKHVSILVTADRRPDLLESAKGRLTRRELDEAIELCQGLDKTSAQLLGLSKDIQSLVEWLKNFAADVMPDPQWAKKKARDAKRSRRQASTDRRTHEGLSTSSGDGQAQQNEQNNDSGDQSDGEPSGGER